MTSSCPGRGGASTSTVRCVLLGLATASLATSAEGAGELYEGPLRVTSSQVEARARSGAVDVTVQYKVVNTGKLALVISARSVQAGPASKPSNPQAVGVGPGERRQLAFQYSLPSGAGAFHSVRLDPSLLFDGRLYATRVPESQLIFRLPPSGGRFVAATRPPDDRASPQPTAPLRWLDRQLPLRAYAVHWTDQAVDLSLSKRTAGLGDAGQFAVDVRVKNTGSAPLGGLVLRDDFPEGVAAPARDEASVSVVADGGPGDDDDVHYRWEARVDDLRAGEERAFSYRLSARSARTDLPPASAWLNGSVVALSNGAAWSVPRAPGPTSVLAQPTGWQLAYEDHDNWLQRLQVLSQPAAVDAAQDRLTGGDEVELADESHDDPYRWVVESDVLSIPDAVVVTGQSRELSSRAVPDGQPNQRLFFQQVDDASYTDARLVGLEAATVLPRGWSLQFTSGDHMVRKAGVAFENILFDPATGTVSWRASAWLSDINFDDPFHWSYAWQIVGLRNGRVFVYPRSGASSQGTHVDQPSVPLPPLASYENRAVVPVGWTLEYVNDEHNLRSVGLGITNPTFDGSSLGWTATLDFADDSGDDPFQWEYAVAVLAWNGGGRGHRTAGPETVSAGGWVGRPYSVRLGDVLTPATWSDGIQDGTEAGVDCGGASPSRCVQCLAPGIEPGSAEDAGFYSLDSVEVLSTAQAAIAEHALDSNQDPSTYYAGPEAVDRYVQAVAAYVDRHMAYASDTKIGDWHGGQSALTTIRDSGSRGCGKDYCGDCEDFSFLRAALLRALRVSWKCVFSARHPGDLDVGQVCGEPTKGHVFNVVYYKGKYRILDYGADIESATGFRWSSCWQAHALNNVFNDHYGHLNGSNLRPIDGQLLMNYPGQASCPHVTWDWRTYYSDVCP